MSVRDQRFTRAPHPNQFPSADDPDLPTPLGVSTDVEGAELGSPVRMTYHGMSDRGLCRTCNEDFFLADPRIGFFVVCDGVGGRPFGALAARATAVNISKSVRRDVAKPVFRASAGQAGSAPGGAPERVVRPMMPAVARACGIVRAAMEQTSTLLREMGKAEPRLLGMSTTASVVLVVGETAVVGHVGDSRVYHGRGANIRQITEDHTLRNLQIKSGLAPPNKAAERRSPVTRLIGLSDSLEVDIVTVPLVRGDRLLLCSDGLHKCFEDDAVLPELLQRDVQDAAETAVRYANARGGLDNITAVFVEVVGGDPRDRAMDGPDGQGSSTARAVRAS